MFGLILKIFCPKLLSLSHLDDFNKNAHSGCERGIIEVDESPVKQLFLRLFRCYFLRCGRRDFKKIKHDSLNNV